MEENTPTVSLVSCMHFVRRGVAKAVPEKVKHKIIPSGLHVNFYETNLY